MRDIERIENLHRSSYYKGGFADNYDFSLINQNSGDIKYVPCRPIDNTIPIK